MNNVCKWGGSSLSCGDRVLKVCDFIIQKNIKIVVVSAPGKTTTDDIKITDLLIKASQEPKSFDEIFNQIYKKYNEILTTLKIPFDLDKELTKIKNFYQKHNDNSFLYSRGEYLNAKIISKYLGYHFVDSRDIIKFDKDGKLLSQTYELIRQTITKYKKVVIPGFYGSYRKKIKIFSRGGSDITGAIIAKALNKDYYNFTDIDGIYNTYPLTNKSKKLKTISYDDMKFLGLFGFGVLHHKCCDILKDSDIKIHLKSSFEPLKQGSIVQKTSTRLNASSTKNFFLISSKKDISGLLKNARIFIYFSCSYLDNKYYVVDVSSKKYLEANKIFFEDVFVTAIVGKNEKYAFCLSSNQYLSITKKTP